MRRTLRILSTVVCLPVLPIWSIEICSSSDALTGAETLSHFSSCAGFTSDDVTSIFNVLEVDGALDSSLKGSAEACSFQPTSSGKQLCLASFMNTLGQSGIFPISSGSSNDIINTCGCLTTALESMPKCGDFSSFFELDEVLPTEQGVCTDLSEVCEQLSLFEKQCIPTERTSQSYEADGCKVAENEAELSCETHAEYFFAAKVQGAQNCGFPEWKLERLRKFYDSCAISFSDTESVAKTRSTRSYWSISYPVNSGKRAEHLFLAVAVLAGVVCSSIMVARYRRRGFFWSSSGYVPLGHDEVDEKQAPSVEPL